MTFPNRELAQVTLCQQQTYFLIKSRPASHRTPPSRGALHFYLALGFTNYIQSVKPWIGLAISASWLLLRSPCCSATKSGRTEEYRGIWCVSEEAVLDVKPIQIFRWLEAKRSSDWKPMRPKWEAPRWAQQTTISWDNSKINCCLGHCILGWFMWQWITRTGTLWAIQTCACGPLWPLSASLWHILAHWPPGLTAMKKYSSKYYFMLVF